MERMIDKDRRNDIVGLIVFLFCVILIVSFFSWISQYQETNEQKLVRSGWNNTYSISVSSAEFKCWEFCNKGNYFYSSGNAFKQERCECGQEALE